MSMQAESRVRSMIHKYLEAEGRLCIERARLATRSYQETEGEPEIIRAAKALAAVLNGIGVWIDEDELIAGHWASVLRGVPVWPEFGRGATQMGFERGGFRALAMVSEEARPELDEILSYWKGRNYTDRVVRVLPEEVNAARQATLWYWYLGVVGNRRGRYLIDLPTVLDQGFSGIKQTAADKLEALDLEESGAMNRQFFYRAVVMVSDAVADFSRRYAARAREMAAAADSARKKELEEMARACDRVPAEPPETFYQALQSTWFAFLVANLETGGDSISFGGLDQILYPYYKTDVDQGRLTRDEARELLEEFLFKVNESAIRHQVYAVTIGRQTEHGADATNEMTYLLLDALERVRLPEPQFALRVNKRTPRELLMRAIDVMRVSGGRPQLNNDDAIIPAMLRRGVPIKEARDYSVDGCQHFTTYRRKDHSAWYNLVKTLDLALNNGVDRLSGRRLGPPTGDPRTFATFDEVMSAYRQQLAHGIKLLNTESELVDASLRGEMYLPYASIHVRGCLDRGVEVLEGGGEFNWTGMHGVGLGTAANSLAALKKVVFEDQRASMPELIDALDKNFEGTEALRQRLIQAPKWGNDDDSVDAVAVEVANCFLDEVDRHRCHTDPEKPGWTIAGFHSLTFSEQFGEATAATPDGRRAGERVSDGIAPAVGTYHGGPTAVFSSAAKLDHARTWTSSLTLTLNEPTEIVANLARTYLSDMGGTHLMGNLVSLDTLRDAREHPENYPDLLVRVAGFSARFVELPTNLRDLIVQRAAIGK